MGNIKVGDTVKVLEGHYIGNTNSSPYNLPRGEGVVVRGGTDMDFICIRYDDFVSPSVNPNCFEKVESNMFETGKKYVPKGVVGKPFYECVWATDIHATLAWVVNGKDQASTLKQCQFQYYREWVEPPKPRSIKPFWVNIYEDSNGNLVSTEYHGNSKEAAVSYAENRVSWKLVDTIEICYTEVLKS